MKIGCFALVQPFLPVSEQLKLIKEMGVDFVKRFGTRIQHVHWKDMPEEGVEKRGKEFGCGMAVIPLGDGVIDIPAIVNELKAVGFDGATTLEIAGEENVKTSIARLKEWIA